MSECVDRLSLESDLIPANPPGLARRFALTGPGDSSDGGRLYSFRLDDLVGDCPERGPSDRSTVPIESEGALDRARDDESSLPDMRRLKKRELMYKGELGSLG